MANKVSPRLRAKRLRARISRLAVHVLGLNKTVYVDARLGEYENYWREAARLIGAEFERLSESIWEIRLGDRRTRVSNYVVAADDPVTLRMAGDKVLCHRIASEEGVPVPQHMLFDLANVAAARAFVKDDEGPWAIKPAAGSSSALGVTVGITSVADVDEAAVLASLFSNKILLERMVPGESCRLLYLDGELISAVRRRGHRITGDGVSTIRELMARSGSSSLAEDAVCRLHLRAQGVTLASVPAAGQTVVLNGAPADRGQQSELRTIYDESITGLVHEETAELLGKVVRALGSRFTGVDVITTDPSRPLAETGGALLELNTTPGIHHHYQTETDQQTHPVAVAVLESLLGATKISIH
jgi:D-alanine-D-alanine ligase-like ATP-grasp enzyme